MDRAADLCVCYLSDSICHCLTVVSYSKKLPSNARVIMHDWSEGVGCRWSSTMGIARCPERPRFSSDVDVDRNALLSQLMSGP